jgi:hypothetical protein
VLVRGGKAFLENQSKSATWTSRPVLLSQDGESKPDKAKRVSRHMFAPARGEFLCLLSCRHKKVGRHRREAPGESIYRQAMKIPRSQRERQNSFSKKIMNGVAAGEIFI